MGYKVTSLGSSVPRVDRSASEPVIDADAGNPERVLIVKPLGRSIAVENCEAGIEHSLPLGEPDVESLRLEAPVAPHGPLGADASRPAPPCAIVGEGLGDSNAAKDV